MFKYKKATFRIDIVYPNKMYGGVYSLGPLIVYNLVNNRDNWYCERVFLDHGKSTAPLVGFSLQYEPDLKNVLKMKPKKGLVFAGGPLVNNNLKLVEEYFDFLFLGDIEVPLVQVLGEYEKGEDGFLDRITNIKGVYVPGKNEPSFYTNTNLDDVPYPLVQPFPDTINEEYVFGNCFMLEIERGCPYCCKFCAIPTFYKGVKFRSLEKLKEIIDEGIRINKPEKIVIYAPSFVHPKRKELLEYLITKKLRIVVPSIKAEHMDKELLTLVKKGGQQSITIAPETGERLRFEMNKKIKDEVYFTFVENCNNIGIKKIKMYMLIGVPGMTQDDLEELVLFTKKMKKRFKGRLYLSINYCVPKPGTPFANEEFDRGKCKEHAKFVQRELKEFRVKVPKLSTSFLEWKISQNGL